MSTDQKLALLLQRYATEKIQLWQNFPLTEVALASEAVWKAYTSHHTIYACGNGGNIAVAANMINDFCTVPFMPDTKDTVLPATIHRLRGITLGESPTALTATMNDLGPEYVFSDQLRMHGLTAGDVLFSLSGSGNSANIIAATMVARELGATVIGITRGPAGKLIPLSDIAILIRGESAYPGQTGSNNFNFHYEDAVSAIGHMITGLLKEQVNSYVTAVPART